MSVSSSRAPQRWGVACIGAAVLAVILMMAPPSRTSAADNMRVCGITPAEADGFYSYIRARNVSCSIARHVGRQASRNFCGHRYQHCNVEPTSRPKKGHTTAKGWRCKVKVGYESFKAKCRRHDQSFVQASAV